MNKKNIIIPASILIIIIALFVIFNPTNTNKNSNTNQSSTSSSITTSLPKATIKDNKIIELEPNLKEN
jgi:poly-D-alanine transfer protein DltD